MKKYLIEVEIDNDGLLKLEDYLFEESYIKNYRVVDEKTVQERPSETEKCECDSHTGTPVRCPWCPIHGDDANPHQPETEAIELPDLLNDCGLLDKDLFKWMESITKAVNELRNNGK